MATSVFLVEPDEERREEFAASIAGSQFEVTHFADINAEAVDRLEESRAQILVLRMVSGKLGAAVAIDRLRRRCPKCKFVVSYDVASTHLLMSVYSHGAVAAIKWPFHLHRVVEKLTYAIASEQRDKLAGPIVRLEHPLQVRCKVGSVFSFARVGFCERLGLTDMDLNTEKPFRVGNRLRLEIMFPPPTGTMAFRGTVEETEQTRLHNWCVYVSLTNTTEESRRLVESFLVKSARRG
jgi:CheY-like chemotaxis protein